MNINQMGQMGTGAMDQQYQMMPCQTLGQPNQQMQSMNQNLQMQFAAHGTGQQSGVHGIGWSSSLTTTGGSQQAFLLQQLQRYLGVENNVQAAEVLQVRRDIADQLIREAPRVVILLTQALQQQLGVPVGNFDVDQGKWEAVTTDAMGNNIAGAVVEQKGANGQAQVIEFNKNLNNSGYSQQLSDVINKQDQIIAWQRQILEQHVAKNPGCPNLLAEVAALERRMTALKARHKQLSGMQQATGTSLYSIGWAATTYGNNYTQMGGGEMNATSN